MSADNPAAPKAPAAAIAATRLVIRSNIGPIVAPPQAPTGTGYPVIAPSATHRLRLGLLHLRSEGVPECRECFAPSLDFLRVRGSPDRRGVGVGIRCRPVVRLLRCRVSDRTAGLRA